MTKEKQQKNKGRSSQKLGAAISVNTKRPSPSLIPSSPVPSKAEADDEEIEKTDSRQRHVETAVDNLAGKTPLISIASLFVRLFFSPVGGAVVITETVGKCPGLHGIGQRIA